MTADPRFAEPAGFQRGVFRNARHAEIRYGHAKGGDAGTVVILPGMGEPFEKYFEVANEQQADGYDVWLMDWRGQGGSSRYLPGAPQKAHHEGYAEQVETLHRFMQEIVTRKKTPVCMLAHSMGAHIGLHYLAGHRAVFDRAVMTAPMTGIHTAPWPQAVVRLIAAFSMAAGFSESYVVGGRDWTAMKRDFSINHATSDPDRYRVQEDIFRENAALCLGSATYGWLYHSFNSLDALARPGYLESVKIPVLMQVSGQDVVVDSKAAARVAERLRCKRVDIQDAKHEIWMERDELRAPWRAEVKSFLRKGL